MISRCLECYSPIFHGSCRCAKNVVRCPDCDGSGRQKTIELLDDVDGEYMGYILKSQNTECTTCRGRGRVSVIYGELVE